MPSVHERWQAFRALHEGPGVFVMANAWDAGSSRILTGLDFEALGTTSAGLAFATGYRDGAGNLTRATALENARAIVDATPLPVSADLEEGYARSPDDVAETIRQAAAIGLVGGSIEDATGHPARPLFERAEAVERVAAAAEAARGLPFVLTARSECFLHGRPDLEEVIARLQAFEAAGADVLYAPGLPSLEAIRTVCRSVTRPVNVVMGLTAPALTVAQLEEAGVRRVSVGGSFARAALGALVRAGREVRDHGTFTYADDALPSADAGAFMRDGS